MVNSWKAVPYTVEINHESITYSSLEWPELPSYTTHETRYRIIEIASGKVLDDAQGHGYRTMQKAYAVYEYKTRDKSKDKRKRMAKHWLSEHKDMEGPALDIAKGQFAPGAKFGAKQMQGILDNLGLHPEFTAAELLRAWKRR